MAEEDPQRPPAPAAPPPGWWKASDGRWYPPETLPHIRDQLAGQTTEAGMDNVDKVAWAGIGGAGVGSVLPWGTVGPFTINGLEGDGVLTLILSAIAGLLYWRSRSRSGRPVGATVALGLAALIYVYDLVNVASIASEARSALFNASPAFGLIFGAVASVAGSVALGLQLRR